MSVTDIPISDVDIASPCPAAWDKMTGDDRVRFCTQCRLHVYNLSAMERAEVEALVQHTEGRLCVRFYRRADGTLLTQDCPTGRKALAWSRRRARICLACACAALFGVA